LFVAHYAAIRAGCSDYLEPNLGSGGYPVLNNPDQDTVIRVVEDAIYFSRGRVTRCER
jgi:hypothetical protein